MQSLNEIRSDFWTPLIIYILGHTKRLKWDWCCAFTRARVVKTEFFEHTSSFIVRKTQFGLDPRRALTSAVSIAAMKVDLCELISQIREDRTLLVQHTIQYKFAYQACMDYAKSIIDAEDGGDIYALASDQTKDMRKLIDKGNQMSIKITGKSRYQTKVLNGNDVYTISPEAKVTLTEAELKKDLAEGNDDDEEPVTIPAAEPKAVPLEKQPWFRHAFSRTQVDDLLADAQPGTFIVRQSAKDGGHVLSVLAPSRTILNVRIVEESNGGVTKYKLGSTGMHQKFCAAPTICRVGSNFQRWPLIMMCQHALESS